MRRPSASRPAARAGERGLLRTVLEAGGPGFCQFAVTNACNARSFGRRPGRTPGRGRRDAEPPA